MKYAMLYKQFGSKWDGLDFSEEALVEMFNKESTGSAVNETTNGFYIGKQWMGVTVSMWMEDRAKGELTLYELYEDKTLPRWWIDTLFKDPSEDIPEWWPFNPFKNK